MEDATRRFNAIDNKTEMKEILTSVYHSLVVKGYNPINQLVGYKMCIRDRFRPKPGPSTHTSLLRSRSSSSGSASAISLPSADGSGNLSLIHISNKEQEA